MVMGFGGTAALNIVIMVKNQATAALLQAQSNIKTLGAAAKAMRADWEPIAYSLRTLGYSLTIAGGAMGLMLKSTIGTFAEWEKEVIFAGAVARLTAGEMELVKKTTVDMSRASVFSATELAAGFTVLFQAGYNLNDAMASLPFFAKLATASQTDLAETIDRTSVVMRGFGLGMQDISHIGDVMLKVANVTTTNFTDLSRAFVYAGPLARAAGMSFDDTAIALGLLANAGFQATLGGTALRTMLSHVLGPSKEAMKAIGDIEKSLHNAKGGFVGMERMLEIFREKGVSVEKVMKLLAQRGGPGFLGMMLQGKDAWQTLKNEVESAAGTIDDMNDRVLEGTEAQLKITKHDVEALQIAIGKELKPTLIAILTPVDKFLTYLSELNPAILKWGGLIFAATTALFLLLGGLAITAALVPSLVIGLAAIGTALTFSSPIIFAIATIGALLLVGYKIWQNWDEIIARLKISIDQLKQSLSDVLSAGGLLPRIPGLSPISNLEEKVRAEAKATPGMTEADIQAEIADQRLHAGYGPSRTRRPSFRERLQSGRNAGVAPMFTPLTGPYTPAMIGAAAGGEAITMPNGGAAKEATAINITVGAGAAGIDEKALARQIMESVREELRTRSSNRNLR